MPMRWEPRSFPFVGGLDTKIAGFALPAPRLQVCENAYVERSGTLRKRKGLQAMNATDLNDADIDNLVALANYREQLMGFSVGQNSTRGKAYEYASGASRWVDKGDVDSFRLRTAGVAGGSSGGVGVGNMDHATCTDISSVRLSVYAYTHIETAGATQTASVRITLIDSSGTVYAEGQSLFSTTTGGASGIKVLALADKIHVFYFDDVAGDLMDFIIDASNAASINASLAGSSVSVANDIDVTTPIFDVAVNTNRGIFVAYLSTTANTLKWGFVDSAGTLANTSTYLAAAAPTGVSVAVSPGLVAHGIAFITNALSSVFALHRSWNGTVWASTATSGALDTTLVTAAISVACTFGATNTVLRVFYSGDNTNLLGGSYLHTHQSTYTTAGVATSRVASLPHSILASKPFNGSDGDVYYWVVTGPALNITQPSLYLMRDDNTVVAMANQGVALYLLFSPYGLPQVCEVDDSYTFINPYLTRITAAGSYLSTGSEVALRAITIDMVHDESHKTVEAGQCLYMSGGMMLKYDGARFVEAGFLRFVDSDDVTISGSVTAGSMTATAQYSYMIVPEDTNLRGEREQGTNNGAISVTLGVGVTAADIVIECWPWTLRDFSFAIYRTGPNPSSDSPYYKIATIANDPTADTVTYTDTAGSIDTREQFNDVELDNTTPPPGYIFASGNGRLFVAGLPDDENIIAVSKLRQGNDPLLFNDALTIQIPDTGGPIMAMAMINETLVVFKKRSIYRVRGSGPNNLGFGEFLEPEVVSGDVGCVSQRGCVAVPAGVMFQTTKGIYLLDQSFQLNYIGAPMEGLGESEAVPTGATLVPRERQVRFTYSDLGTIVYDYFHGQWYLFTTISDGPSVVWDDEYTTIVSGNPVRENDSTFADAGVAFTMRIVLAWVKAPGTAQGLMRFRRIGLLFTNEGIFTLNLTISGDYGIGTASEFQTITETALAAGTHEMQWRLDEQLFSSLQVEIDDNGATTQSVVLVELVFEIGVKSGLDRLDT